MAGDLGREWADGASDRVYPTHQAWLPAYIDTIDGPRSLLRGTKPGEAPPDLRHTRQLMLPLRRTRETSLSSWKAF